MPSASVSGLASGLDTATIISQLLQVEARPQTLLKSKVSSEKSALSSLQTLNSRLLTIATKATDLAKLASWSPATATSSSDKVTATADAGTPTGSFRFTVDNVAVAHRVSYRATSGTMDMSTVVATPGSQITIATGTSTQTVSVGDGTLTSVIAAINGTGLDVHATAVRTDNGYLLNVGATRTGAASQFTITGLDQLSVASSENGADARISFDGTGLSSPNDTFTDVLAGLDITVSGEAVGTSVTVTVTRDTKAMTASVQALVDAANAVLTDIASLTAYKTSTTAAGALAGDSTLRAVRDQLVGSISNGIGGRSLADVGLEVDRYGKITFDAEAFEAAYAADPTGTADRFAGTAPEGFAARLAAIAGGASDATTGSVTAGIKGRTSSIDSLEDAIASWDVRLTKRRETLERQYAALEVALQRLQSQSSWLAGQIAGLPSYDSGS